MSKAWRKQLARVRTLAAAQNHGGIGLGTEARFTKAEFVPSRARERGIDAGNYRPRSSVMLDIDTPCTGAASAQKVKP